MKKFFALLGLCAFVAILGSSCTKTCICKTYSLNNVISTDEIELNKSVYKECSDMNTIAIVGGYKSGLECK